jgi:hypothetical protein
MLVAHRRAGKTVSVINDIIERATYNTRPSPRYAYVAPFLKQAKDIAWLYLKEYAAPFQPKINESGLFVELLALPNAPRITLYGADNPDSFRGIYLDGLALDEFGNMKLSTWKEILLPTLIDRRGWAVFMGTPNGPNHFRDMWYDALEKDDWFTEFLPVNATNIIPEDDLLMMKGMMDPEQYAQEMLCSFEASVRGAIYARQMEQMEQEGRIGDYHAQKGLPVDVVMDLGYRDLTVANFTQERPDGILVDKCIYDNLKPIGDYIREIKEYFALTGHRMGTIWLPHDARAKSLQTGKSIVEQFIAAKLRPKIIPELSLLDGIAAARQSFPHYYFNKDRTKDLVLALKSYHRKYDEDRKVFTDEPVHDWSSHFADTFRYDAIVHNRRVHDTGPRSGMRAGIVDPTGPGVHYGFALDDIWDTQPKRGNRL